MALAVQRCPKQGGSALPSRTPPEAMTELELHAVEGTSS